MSLPRTEVLYSPEEYLALERSAEERHEYLDGVVYQMSGESLSHSRICINISGEMRNLLRGKPCEALSPNMKVRARTKGLFAYPDLTIVCGEPVFHDHKRDVLLNPKVIFEVLSPSTERYDRTQKFFRYRVEIESLTDYVLITQDEPLVEHYEKQADGRWVYYAHAEIDDQLHLNSIGCVTTLREIYERVEFSTQPEDMSAETED